MSLSPFDSVKMQNHSSIDTTVSTTSSNNAEFDEPAAKRKKKLRPTGDFRCDHEGCDKSFTRSEHLSRHKLNHNPTVIYSCHWPDCTKSFVRSDLKERHVRRHEARKLKEEAKLLKLAENGNKRRKTKGKNTSSGSISKLEKKPDVKIEKLPINSLDSIILPNIEGENSVNIHRYGDQHHRSAASDEVNALKSGGIVNDPLINGREPFSDTPSHETTSTDNVHLINTIDTSSGGLPSEINTVAASPSHLINWLFDENQMNNEIGDGNLFNPEDDPFEISSNLLNDLLSIPPNFPNPAQQTLVTPDVIHSLVELIPSIANHDYLQYIDHFLELYWNCFHIQYPILHKPSFNTFTCPPILLLSMIMTGASYATSEPNSKLQKNPREFADIIAEPLRFIIFKSRDLNPPSKVWIIQSLLLLECYERLSSNRILHERAFIHHGATIQLLRRSPGLGGDPLHNKTDYNNRHNGTIWEKWIEFETLKRTALFAFFIDATHSIVFGYQQMLHTHQIQLSLPCDDELWESYLNPKEIPSKNDTLPFSVGLKKLLNREHVATSRYGNKILLSGLVTIMFQMQQRDLQGSIIEVDQLRDTWKDTLSLAFDYWTYDIMNGCCNTRSAVYYKRELNNEILPLTLRDEDTRCKYPVYHMAQITLRIQHYDYYIYSGAPWRMNVEAENSDYELVERKIKEWANSSNGRISVVYAYLFMFEMFLSPQDSPNDYNYTNYDANTEAIYNRLNVLALVALLLWSYNYSLHGPESRILLTHEPDQVELVPKEDAFGYLRRIRSEFTKTAKEPIHVGKKHDSLKYSNLVRIIANKSLADIQGGNNITGLLMLISKIFKDCYWEVGNEFSRLIWNVCQRSFGSPKIRCDDMYNSTN